MSELESSKSELEEAVTLRDNELDILRSCVAQVTKASSDDGGGGEEDVPDHKKEQTLQALMDTAKVRHQPTLHSWDNAVKVDNQLMCIDWLTDLS